METKSPLLSKTIWVNALIGIAGILGSFGLIPSVSVWLHSHADMVLSGVGVLGVGLRLITKDKISLGE